MPLYLRERWRSYTSPLSPLAYGFTYLIESLRGGFDGSLDRAFALWYSRLGHFCAAFEAQTPVPRLVALAEGVTLEVGPGSGIQFPYFDRSKVSRIYGVEPNKYLVNLLKDETIGKHNLGDIYVPINAALEDEVILASEGIEDNSLDSIVCMQILCSAKDPEKAAKRMYQLLKPGGQLLFWEHHRSNDMLTRIVQGFWNLAWTPLIGGCSLTRDVEQALNKAGDWKIVESGHDDQNPWNMKPRFWGHFIKNEIRSNDIVCY